jgi:hypothetical protein
LPGSIRARPLPGETLPDLAHSRAGAARERRESSVAWVLSYSVEALLSLLYVVSGFSPTR